MMHTWTKKRDILLEKYCDDDALNKAHALLQQEEQTEEAFLGAQGILLLHGLI